MTEDLLLNTGIEGQQNDPNLSINEIKKAFTALLRAELRRSNNTHTKLTNKQITEEATKLWSEAEAMYQQEMYNERK